MKARMMQELVNYYEREGKMREELAGALRRIEDDLMNPVVGEDLWNVLSALRGPDEDANLPFKSRTTAVIRTAAFPRVRSLFNRPFCAEFAPPFVPLSQAESHGHSHGHFAWHIRWAAKALDLA